MLLIILSLSFLVLASLMAVNASGKRQRPVLLETAAGVVLLLGLSVAGLGLYLSLHH
jgi:hypothetical protein